LGACCSGDDGLGARRAGDKGVGARRAGDKGWAVMLAMSASMPRAMNARAGDVLILLGEARAGC
jgi:hypothetical protein